MTPVTITPINHKQAYVNVFHSSLIGSDGRRLEIFYSTEVDAIDKSAHSQSCFFSKLIFQMDVRTSWKSSREETSARLIGQLRWNAFGWICIWLEVLELCWDTAAWIGWWTRSENWGGKDENLMQIPTFTIENVQHQLVPGSKKSWAFLRVPRIVCGSCPVNVSFCIATFERSSQ